MYVCVRCVSVWMRMYVFNSTHMAEMHVYVRKFNTERFVQECDHKLSDIELFF